MVWMMAVERGSHWVNISESRLLRSWEFKSRWGILRFSVETILLIFSAFLWQTLAEAAVLIYRKKILTGLAEQRRTPPKCSQVQIAQTTVSANGL
jgi:hypothetical protein